MSLRRFKAAMANAFAVERKEPSANDLKFIESVCGMAKSRSLEFPLLIFLEGLRPLTTVAAGVLTGLEPAAELFFPVQQYRDLVSFLENRGNLDRMIANLEDPGPGKR